MLLTLTTLFEDGVEAADDDELFDETFGCGCAALLTPPPMGTEFGCKIEVAPPPRLLGVEVGGSRLPPTPPPVKLLPRIEFWESDDDEEPESGTEDGTGLLR